ncbi:hypothetical protein, partial [Actinocorallia longicatena]|uniref:hypothetical protein n=1 Tax=Actinocorallia longicatena TaxID=111803 RepID=UPI0031E4802E
ARAPHPAAPRKRRTPTVRRVLADAAILTASLALVLAALALTTRHQPAATGQTPPPTTSATPTTTRILNALNRMEPVVDEALSTGEIRSDVALDLHNVINGLKRLLDAPASADLPAALTGLQEKITTRLDEGAISPPRATQLTTILSTP